MLVVSRKVGEKVTLTCADGTVIEVALVDVDRGKVRIGFAAPRSVVIMRNELLQPVPAALVPLREPVPAGHAGEATPREPSTPPAVI